MQVQVQKSCEHAHLYFPFAGALAPLEVAPGLTSMTHMLDRGRDELARELPFITRMMQVLEPLD